MKYSALFTIVLFVSTNLNAQDNSKQIIQSAIETYGGEGFAKCEISFDFRDKHYDLIHNDGLFEYYRKFDSPNGQIVDKLDNNGFERKVDGNVIDVWSNLSAKYSNSINSVMYFALLPYKLSDPAVNSKSLGRVNIAGKAYHKIKVTFNQESGGEDFEDVFVYWFSVVDYSMDYLAYSYQTDGGGIRFRKARNKRSVGSLVFQDYDNYKADPDEYKVEELDEIFNEGKLELLSKIDLLNIQVKK